MIKIYGMKLDGHADDLFHALPMSILEPWQAQHPNLREENARRASLAGVWLLWKGKSDAELAYTANGKPFLKHFDGSISITHTKTHVFCAISDECGEIGLDAEDFGRIAPDKLDALAARWFTSAEKDAFHRELNEEAFLQIWTKKEAFVKLTGDGMRALHRANTQDDTLGIRYITYRLDRTIVSLAYPENQTPPTEIIFF